MAPTKRNSTGGRSSGRGRTVGGAGRAGAGGRSRGGRAGLDEARRQVEEAAVSGSGQEAIRRRILGFAGDHPDCLHRTCLAGHLTGSAVVVDPRAGRTLLLHHAKLGRWLQPGGHADGDGDLGAVALREAEEETGLDDLALVAPAVDLDIHEIPARGDEPAHLHLDVRYLVLATGSLEPRLNHESHAARWVDVAAPEVVASEELARAVRSALMLARGLPPSALRA